MRKLPDKYENPFDIIIYKIVIKIEPYFREFNFSPNQITTIGNIFGIIGIYKLYHGKYIESAFFYLIRYIFDCLDGYYARKYDEVTIFGDWYDHISDILILIVYFILLYKKNNKIFIKILVIFVIMLYLMLLHFYYQEIYYKNENESPTINTIKKLIPTFLLPKDDIDLSFKLYKTKYFGNGTLVLIIMLILVYYAFNN
jgi:phosphatidylglycerophosphate synthase